MGDGSLEAETRGFNFLHLLAFSHRNDAEQISNKNKPQDGTSMASRGQSAKKRRRGESYLEADMTTRKKERLCTVFSLSDTEYKQISEIRGRRMRYEAALSSRVMRPPNTKN